MTYRILIAAETPQQAAWLEHALNNRRVYARAVKDYSDPLKDFSEMAPDLILLDVRLPEQNGYHWSLELRQHTQVPILFMALPADSLSVNTARSLGGNDVLEKPVTQRLLYDKVTALLRSYSHSSDLRYGSLTLNCEKQQVTCLNQTVRLSHADTVILRTLLEHSGQVISPERLVDALVESHPGSTEKNIPGMVSHLRRRLRLAGADQLICTRRGCGYIIE